MSNETEYANEYQRETVEYLLGRGMTVEADRNSEITVYLSGDQYLSPSDNGVKPYQIKFVAPLRGDEFDTKVILGADWREVDTDND